MAVKATDSLVEVFAHLERAEQSLDSRLYHVGVALVHATMVQAEVTAKLSRQQETTNEILGKISDELNAIARDLGTVSNRW